MNRTHKTLAVASVVLLSGIGLTGIAQADPPATPRPTPVTTPAQKADAELATALAFSREEERMARDLYAQIARKYDDALPFSRITLSEQRHFDAIGTLLERHGVADPSEGRKAGSYADPTIQKLYDGWLTQGSKSLPDAYQVGIALEERDIADLQATLGTTQQDDVKQVLERLLSGSQNHLQAFTAAANGTLEQRQGQRQGRGQDGKRGPRMGQGQSGRGGQAGMGPHGRGGGMQGGGMQGDCPLREG